LCRIYSFLAVLELVRKYISIAEGEKALGAMCSSYSLLRREGEHYSALILTDSDEGREAFVALSPSCCLL